MQEEKVSKPGPAPMMMSSKPAAKQSKTK